MKQISKFFAATTLSLGVTTTAALAEDQSTHSFSAEEQATISLFDSFWECVADTEIQNDTAQRQYNNEREDLWDQRNANPPELTEEEYVLEINKLSRPEKVDATEHCLNESDIADIDVFENNLQNIADKYGDEVLEDIVMKHMYRMMFPGL